jgi:signal peptidase I
MLRGRRLLVEAAVVLVTALVLALGVRGSVAQAFRIPSASMQPQLEVGDRVVVSRLAYRLHDPRRGDVVVFPCPPAACGDRDDDYIKRVIGLPGEQVEGRGGSVWIEGHRLQEPYLPAGVVTSAFGPVRVPDDAVWVMGDNRGESADSRVFGPVPRSQLIGRAIARVWPPWRTAFL